MHSFGPAKNLRRAIALAVALSLLAVAPVYAAPSQPGPNDSATSAGSGEFQQKLSAKQQELDDFNAQLDELDRNLEIASEQYNSAVSRLEDMKSRVATAQLDLDNAQKAYELQSQILDERASQIYKGGSYSAIEVLLNAKSVGDLLSRVKFLNTVGLRDADIASSLAGQRDYLGQQVVALQTAREEAVALEFEARTRKVQIEDSIAQRQKMLAQVQTELLTLITEEAARRKDEQSKLLADILTGANSKGIVATPGSPVETALAYHGVPYVWGGATPSGFDCSGLVLYVFKQHGVELPHYSGSQFLLGTKVAAGDLQPNDVVFFGSPVHHVGIYIGGGYFIHAPHTGDFVKISKLAEHGGYVGARRYDWKTRVGEPLNAQKSLTSALSGIVR